MSGTNKTKSSRVLVDLSCMQRKTELSALKHLMIEWPLFMLRPFQQFVVIFSLPLKDLLLKNQHLLEKNITDQCSIKSLYL